MLSRFSLSGSLLTLLCFSACSAGADTTLTFNSLSNGSLVGQDGWLFSHNAPLVADGAGVDTTKVVTVLQGDAIAIRPRGVTPTTTNSSVLEFDSNLNSNLGTSLFGLADSTGGNSIAFGLNVPGSGPLAGTYAFELFDRSSSFNPAHALFSPLPNGTASDWYRIRLNIDFAANSGDGSGSLSYEDLTLGQTAYTPVTGIQDINLGLTAGNAATLDPTTWTHDWFYVATNGTLDNLSVNTVAAPSTPEPGTYALLTAGGLSGLLLRRRRDRHHSAVRADAAP